MNVRRFGVILLLGALIMAAPSGYGYYKEIPVQHANIDGNLIDVVTEVPIIDDSDIGGHLEDTTNGYDIRFYDVDTDTEIYFDRAYFNVSAGDCNATFWVKIPYLYTSPTGNENKIRIYYGKVGDSDGQDKANTWSDYIFVHHCADASGTLTDATGTHNSDAQSISNYQQTGKVRYCVDFDDAQSDYATLADHADFDTNTFTAQFWANYDILSTGDYSFYRVHTAGGTEGIAMRGGGTAGVDGYSDVDFYDGGVGRDAQTNANTLDVSVWALLHATMDANGLLLAYADGAVGSNTGDFGGAISWSSSAKFAFGASATPANHINGRLEEIRFTASVLSANHIKFEHANMNEADNELTWGAEQGVGGGALSVSESDPIIVGESASLSTLLAGISISDSIIIGESLQGSILCAILASEPIVVTESIAPFIPLLNIAISDPLIVSESISLDTLIGASVFDPVIAIDVIDSIVVVIGVPEISVSENIIIGESVGFLLPELYFSISQPIIVSEYISVVRPADYLEFSVSDAIIITETVRRGPAARKEITENLGARERYLDAVSDYDAGGSEHIRFVIGNIWDEVDPVSTVWEVTENLEEK